MRIGKHLVTCALACAASGVAYADRATPSAEEYSAQIDKVYEANRLSEAWRLSKRAAADYPDNADLRHAYGFMLQELAQFREAAEQFEKAFAIAPDNLDIVVNLAWAHWAFGNGERASALAALAAEKWPADESVIDLNDNIQTESRILAGEQLTYEPGSAAQFVARFAAKVEDGNMDRALLDDLEPTLLDEMVHSTPGSGSRRDWVKGFVKGVTKSWRAQFASKGNRYHGYEVDNEVEEGADGAVTVWVNILMKRRWSEEDVDRVRRMHADPALGHLMEAEMKRVLDGLEPADRKRYLEAQTAYAASSYAPIAVTVQKHVDRWFITDVVVNQSMRLSQIAATVQLMQEKGLAPMTDRPGFAYALGKAVGKLLILFLLLWIAILVWRRVTV